MRRSIARAIACQSSVHSATRPTNGGRRSRSVRSPSPHSAASEVSTGAVDHSVGTGGGSSMATPSVTRDKATRSIDGSVTVPPARLILGVPAPRAGRSATPSV